MKRERLQKLFSEDKEIFQGGMLFPTWICKGKEEIENRNIPQRAAVYLDIPIPCAGLLYYEKEKSLHYCEQQTYQVVTLLEGVGCDYSIEKENWQRLAVLARKGMIDVIVVSGLSRLSYCPEEILQTMEMLQSFQVQIDCIGYGILDYARLKQYLMHTWEKQEQFEQDGGDGTVASWRNTVTVENVHPNTTVSFRMNNLSGSVADLKLYAYGADGKLAEVSKELWTITDEAGTGVDTLADGTLYELRVSVADGGAFDLSEAEKEIKISVVLAK